MAEIINQGGRPAICVNGTVYPPMMATIRTMEDGKRILFDEEYFEALGKSGIRIFFLICDTLWLKPDALQLFRTEAEALLKAVPDALIIPRMGLHPTNEWIAEHPEECVQYSDGERPPVHLFSESYETDLPMHYSTREWDGIPELYEVAGESIDDIALADTMVTYNKSVGHTGGHVAVITDIARDKEGRVMRVEITEGWEPTQRARWDSRKAFEARMLRNGGSYLVFRHKNIDSVRPPVEVLSAPTDLMLDLGAFSAYREGDAVQLCVAKDAEALVIEGTRGDALRIEKERFEKTECDGVMYTTFTATALAPDLYRAYLEVGGEKSAPVEFSVMRAKRPHITKQNGEALPRLAFTPVATDGTPLTKESKCLYKKDTDQPLRCPSYALARDGKLYTAYGALREVDGKWTIHPATYVEDKDGNEIASFEVGKPIELYVAAAEEGESLLVDFSDSHPENAYSLCPKEEAAVTFDQRLITEEEKKEGKLVFPAIPSPYNRFIGLSIVYKNVHGKLTSEPYPMIVL